MKKISNRVIQPSIRNYPQHNSDGRIRGSYIYLLLCQHPPTTVFAKIGISDNPLERIKKVLTSCPFKPGVLATLELPNRRLCRRAELRLHKAFADRQSNGEWFQFTRDEQPWFNQRLQTTLKDLKLADWPMSWTKLNMPQLIAQGRKANSARYHAEKAKGIAYQDFMAVARGV